MSSQGSEAPPLPPPGLPPGRLEAVEGVGEIFFRDSGRGPAGTLLLLHGWFFPADLTWGHLMPALVAAGWRVIAPDLRGHGRGPRPPAPFRLAGCAADSAALLRHLGTGPAIVVGYSMGGAIAQLMARDHPDQVRGVVLSATAAWWHGRAREALFWRTMPVLSLGLRLLPREAWIGLLRRFDPTTPTSSWVGGELGRGRPRDIAEAGRELARFDSRPWAGSLRAPVAVLCTARDTLVPPDRQRLLARLCSARLHEVPIDHGEHLSRRELFLPGLLQAIESVASRQRPDGDVSAVTGS